MTASQIMEATMEQYLKKPMRKKPAAAVASGPLGGKKAAKR